MKQRVNWGKFYSVFSINIVTAFILLLLLNTGMYFASKLLVYFYPARTLSSFSDLQQVYPGLSSDDISTLLDETWNKPYQYEPWLGFKERPRAGKFVNISPDGFRLSGVSDKKLGDSGINVFVFGGSTTFGYGLDDGSTIPSHLQKILTANYPERKINVFNFGRAYYYLEQEGMLLFQLLKNGHTPSIAIFIDGLNEGFSEPFYSKEMAFLFESFNYNSVGLLEKFLLRSPFVLTAKRLGNYINQNDAETQNVDAADSALTLRRYLRTREMITFMADDFNFKAYFFIQPVPGYRNRFQKHMFMKDGMPESLLQHNNIYMKSLDDIVDNKTSYSLTELLKDYPQQPFVDNVHYTSDVCRLVASAIAERIQIN